MIARFVATVVFALIAGAGVDRVPPAGLNPGGVASPGPGALIPAGQQGTNVTGLGYDRGDPEAPILVVEFGDFGCSACAQFKELTFQQFNREFILTGRVRFKFIPFVMGSFPNSREATRAAECAADQSSFWSMHDELFRRQGDWLRQRDPRELFDQIATGMHLDMAKFRECYSSGAPDARIDRANGVAAELKLRGTPTFFINDQQALGALKIEQWRQLIRIAGGTG